MSRWDCENRLIQITYPGMNNKTEMTYSPTGGRVKIVETVSGSVNSTKQFIGSEERDGSGNVVKQFFSRGQRNGSTNLFYAKDHLGSVRTMTDDSGVVQASFGFDTYGRSTKLEGTADSDFGFAGYYIHARSGLNLTRSRAYSAALGRFINRDPIEEAGGSNLYRYALNDPVDLVDPSGMFPIIPVVIIIIVTVPLVGCTKKPDNPYKDMTIEDMEKAGLDQSIIDQEIIRRGQAAGESPEVIRNELQRSHQHLQDRLYQQQDAQRQQNKLPPTKTILDNSGRPVP